MSQPFARSIAMMAMITAAMQLDGGARHLAMSRIGPYESRGKGKNRSKPSPRFGKSNSKYQPHYGAKESAKFCAKHPI